MPRISLDLSHDIEKKIRAEARRRCISISACVAGLLEEQVGKKGWNEEFFTNVIGGWQGDAPEIERTPPEDRGAP